MGFFTFLVLVFVWMFFLLVMETGLGIPAPLTVVLVVILVFLARCLGSDVLVRFALSQIVVGALFFFASLVIWRHTGIHHMIIFGAMQLVLLIIITIKVKE